MNRAAGLGLVACAVAAAAASSALRHHAWGQAPAGARAVIDAVAVAPRPIGSPEAASARAIVRARLEALGLSPEEHRRFVCTDFGACGEAVNLVATVPAAPGAASAPVVLAAHLDTVAASPGAHDDGLGVAVLLEIARRLLDPATQTRWPRRQVILLFDDGEEVGLLGAWSFLQTHPEAAKARLFVTVDGMAGPTVLRTKGPADASMLWALGQVPRAYIHAAERLDVASGGFDDTDAFAALGISSVTVAGNEGYALYHSPLDVPEAVRDATIADRTEATWALLKASFRNRHPHEVHGTYGEVFGRFSYAKWATGLAVALGALLVLLTAFAGTCRGLLHGAGRALVWAAPVLGLRAALISAFVAASAPYSLVSMVSIAAGVGALVGPRRGRPSVEEAQASLLLLGGLAVGLSYAVPPLAFGVSMVAIFAAIGASLDVALSRWTAPAFFAALLAAGVAADQLAAWHQLAPKVHGASGLALALWPEAIVLLVLGPWARDALGGGRRRGAAAIAFGVLWGAVAPRAAHPDSNSVRLIDEGPGRRRVAIFGAATPGQAVALDLDRVAQLYPWSSGDYPVDVAPTEVSAPTRPAVVTSTVPDGVRLTVSVPERTAQLRLAFDPATPPSAVRVEGVSVPLTEAAVRWTHGWRLVTVHGPGPKVVVDVDLMQARLRVDVGALVPGLPDRLAALVASRPTEVVPMNLGDATEARTTVEWSPPGNSHR